MVFARKAAWLAALLAVATIEATGGPHQPAEQDFDDRPNILLIVLDDAGFGDVYKRQVLESIRWKASA